MSDYTDTKPGLGATYPVGAVDSDWGRTEPLIDEIKLKNRFLFGIPLYSAIKDPVTKKAQVMTPDLITDYIDRAAGTVESETGLIIFPTQFAERHPLDYQEYKSFGYFKTEQRPVSSLERLAVVATDETQVYDIPLEWIDKGRLHVGQINILPLTLALATSQGPGGGGAVIGGGTSISPAIIMSCFSQQWISNFFTITYTAGFDKGKIPKVVNDLIGTVAAMDILGMLASTYRNTSGSLSMDGLAQSSSGPGPEVFAFRLQQLGEKRKSLTAMLKTLYGQTFFAAAI